MLSQVSWMRMDQPPRFASWGLLASQALLWLVWLGLHRASLAWLWQSVQALAPLHQVLLGLGLVGLAVWVGRSRDRLPLSSQPVLRAGPVVVAVASSLGAIAFPWLLHLEQIPVGLWLLGTYGLLGLWLAPAFWRRGLAAAMLLACLVPFSLEFTNGLGLPARILTAHWVEQLLRPWQIPALSSEDIIVLEHGIAQVDLPCSGLKSLWTGTVFLLLVTWLEGRRLGLRWLVVCGLNLGLLVAANTGRVLVLVLLTQVARQSDLAALLHLPLGLLGFGAACGLTWLLLRWVPRDRPSNDRLVSNTAVGSTSFKGQIGLVACLVGLMLVPQPAIATQAVMNLEAIALPTTVQTQPLKLNKVEQRFFAEYPGVVATKQQFQFQDLSGSLLLVASPSWQAHHAPEICYVARGFQIDRMERRSLGPELPLRWLSLNQGQQAAVYWFQAQGQTTDDFLTRMWGEITRRHQEWVLVSLLLDQPESILDPQVQALLKGIHQGVGAIAL